MSRDFLQASVAELVQRLTTEEKIKLLAGPNWWNTNSIDRLGIPAIRMSDGPNVSLHSAPNRAVTHLLVAQGVRGSSHFVSTPAQCLPVCCIAVDCICISS